MTLSRAIDRFLAYRQIERDAPPSSLASYYRILSKLADEYPDARIEDFDGRPGKERVLQLIASRWGKRSGKTRATVISYFHSFFAWCEREDLILDDRVRTIERPPARKPDIYRPSTAELLLGRRATTLAERTPWLLLEGVGLRNSEVRACRWKDIDLLRGMVRVKRKGGNWQWVPVAPDILDELRDVYRTLEPDLDHHVFTAETEVYDAQTHRARVTIDPGSPRSSTALWRMVRRVCRRAGIRELYPHQLRHGFSARFVRESREAFGAPADSALQVILGHSSIATTQAYTGQLESEEAAAVLARMYAKRVSQSQGDAEGEPNLAGRPAGFEPAPSAAEPSGSGATELDDDLAPPQSLPEGDTPDAV